MGRAAMKPCSSMKQNTRGFSLVELMVAITIGLIILVSVSGIFITSKTSYNVQDRLARLQENARFAMLYIMKDLRMAGYYGCVPEFNASTLSNSLNTPAGMAFQLTAPLEGLKAGAAAWLPTGSVSVPTGMVSGSDAIAMVLANSSDASLGLTAEMADVTDPVTVAATTLVKKGDVVTVADCAHTDVFQITDVNPSGSNVVLEHAVSASPAPGNATGSLGKTYSPTGGKLIKFVYRRYYIGTGASGVPALFRDGTEGPQELVEGIERMRILYGEDKSTPPDGIPDIYVTPDLVTDWGKVLSVRVGILAVTTSDKAEAGDIDTTSYDIDGDNNTDFTAPGDRNKRRVFLATVMLRNSHEPK
jgi:type IV pilus assembly protein PilW